MAGRACHAARRVGGVRVSDDRSGSGAELWKQRHAQLFALPEKDGVLRAGATELLFKPDGSATTQITATFAVPNPNVSIPLVAGRFEFVPMSAGRSAKM